MRSAVPDDVLANAKLVVSELVTNSLRHSRARRRGDIVLEVALDPGGLRVSVTDPGPGFEPRDDPDPWRHEHWGLFLVERLATRWGTRPTERGGTEVWAELAVPPRRLAGEA